MAWLFRVVVAATLVVHLMVGCCAHHAHASDSTAHSGTGHEDATTHGDCPCDRDSDSDHGNHGSHDCQGNPCSFILPSHLDNHPVDQPLPGFVATLVDDQPSQAGLFSGQCSTPLGWFLLPVRLHLANQVLLI
jgi:hypothetical protein